jgi:putative salt-induced outer membrane protein
MFDHAKKWSWMALAGVMTLCAAVAQAEEPLKEPEPPKWNTTLALGFSLTEGNSDTMLATLSLEGVRETKKNTLRLGASGSYGETEDEVTTQRARVYADYRHILRERMYAYVASDLLHDDVADIQYRFTLGPGLGYYFIQNDKMKLSGEVGPSYVLEKLNDETRDYAALRVAERFDHKLTEGAKWWQSAEYLAEFADFGNYDLVFELGAEAALNKKLSLRVVGIDRYKSEPAPGRKSNDIAIISSLVYKF